MNSKVPTGDNIFAEDTSAVMSEGRGVAHFATSVAKRAGPGDTKTKWKVSTQLEPFKPRGTTDARTRRKPEVIKTAGKADAKTKKKIVVTPTKRVGPGDAKTRTKMPPPPNKISGTRDAKTKRKRMLHKEPGTGDAKATRKVG